MAAQRQTRPRRPTKRAKAQAQIKAITSEGPRTPRDLDTEFLVCRAMGHSWVEVNNPVSLFGVPKWGVWEAKRCRRCKSSSGVCVNHLGEISYRRYRYVAGYVFVARKQRGGAAFAKADYRKELFKRKWYEQRAA